MLLIKIPARTRSLAARNLMLYNSLLLVDCIDHQWQMTCYASTKLGSYSDADRRLRNEYILRQVGRQHLNDLSSGRIKM